MWGGGGGITGFPWPLEMVNQSKFAEFNEEYNEILFIIICRLR